MTKTPTPAEWEAFVLLAKNAGYSIDELAGIARRRWGRRLQALGRIELEEWTRELASRTHAHIAEASGRGPSEP